ncbi:MAG: hypothetical protein KGS49_11375 [Planctomycetes bacterium]|nr:hypothetical protein [Planctomycetota bacterium]
MASDNGLSQKSLGFVSVRQRLDQGYFGGYLLVNSVARPLEFHCTVPVQPTRAQSILFGPTLEEFLCGEQIARALLSRAKVQPHVVLVDAPAVLCARQWIDLPILWITGESASSVDHGFQYPGFQRHASQYAQITQGPYTFACLDSYRGDLELVDWMIEAGAMELDLKEPFERIVEALAEAHPRSKVA